MNSACAAQSLSMATQVEGVAYVGKGTMQAPARRIPTVISTYDTEFGANIATLSSGATPRSISARAIWLAR
jgi:hypothetical protein